MKRTLAPLLLLPLVASLHAETLSLTIKPPAPAGPTRYMGQGTGSISPTPGALSNAQVPLGYNNLSLVENGNPILPVMGEFHYSRYAAGEWREELLKMKAGGITVVATYVFWIHHEETQGQFDWSGQRSLKDFIQTARDVGLRAVVRIGPWCHGEVRNGGMPDWADAMPRKRTADPAFLAAVRPLYQQISEQLKGQLWKDGGPVIGIQVDNEFGGDPAYLLALKSMARDVGLDVPLYIKTGWPAMRRPVPFGELMPLYGGYAEGFWDRSLDSMPGNYWQAFTFNTERIDTAIASDTFGNQAAATQSADTLSYPYLTCELGGGMMSSYHRRIKINPMDVLAIPICKVGSGSNLPGYYMYHGGTNPDGKTTTIMQETQSRNMWNDLPYKTYDFQAPLGEFGQIRESYHLLRYLHLFLQDYGSTLARMTPTFPPIKNAKNNAQDLRFAVRSDGDSGFLFINNYQRGLNMGARHEQRFALRMPSGKAVSIPTSGTMSIPANTCYFLPFNVDLGGLKLLSATAQPVCLLRDGDTQYTFFAKIEGIMTDFAFNSADVVIDESTGTIVTENETTIVENTKVKGIAAGGIRLHTTNGQKHSIILFDPASSHHLWKGKYGDQDQVVFYPGNLVFDKSEIRITAGPNTLINYFAIPRFHAGHLFTVALPSVFNVQFQKFQEAGRPTRTIKLGSQKVAEQPTDDDFAGAQPAVFQMKVPNLGKGILRIHYTGDVARVYLGDNLLTDNFYNGDPLEIGVARFPDLAKGATLTVKILPLQKNAPIYLAKWPDMSNKEAVANIEKVEFIPEFSLVLDSLDKQ